MTSTDTSLIVGRVYEVDPWFKISVNGGLPSPRKFYGKLIGFNSDNKPVFERERGDYACWSEEGAKITPVTEERRD